MSPSYHTGNHSSGGVFIVDEDWRSTSKPRIDGWLEHPAPIYPSGSFVTCVQCGDGLWNTKDRCEECPVLNRRYKADDWAIKTAHPGNQEAQKHEPPPRPSRRWWRRRRA